ncbi:solute carrier family 12 member 9-like [Pollicipes pollicipes]|uniref:solute carrier family 12 member 9-like n=1 Tax=Pollicipes pollicipes TaxID=41117 RepID=UPI001884E2D7|nr:solute carrier family 12 member 9-like [Pollicipes pollicipes]
MVLLSRPSIPWRRASRRLEEPAPPPPPPEKRGATKTDHSPLLEPAAGPAGSRKLGTVLGVLVPVVLSQFSSLLFLRVGYIVGQSGLVLAIVQLVLAYAILLVTILSLCALCTNGAISGGGSYYMISRTLGPEFGGSVGVLFLFANIFSSALYISGCVEGMVNNLGIGGTWNAGMPDGGWWRFLYGFCINLLNFLVCVVGPGMYTRAVLVIILLVLVCLGSVVVSFGRTAMEVMLPEANMLVQNSTFRVNATFTGFNTSTLEANLWPAYAADYTDSQHAVPNFFTVFAVLFSGVTGIMAGANMSGELANPGRSIPGGTLPAQAVSFCTYLLLFFLTAATSSHFLLVNNYIYMMDINYWSGFVFFGIVLATVSASLSNLMGASRVLDALVKDKLFGNLQRLVAKTTWHGNPLGSLALCFIGVQLVLLVGSLNQIARFTSIFFLMSYFAVHLATLGLEWASAPNFRPEFAYFTWHTCLGGMIGTLAMSLLVSWWCMLVSVAVCVLLVILIHNFSPATENNWGSLSQALIFHQVRKYLLLLDPRKAHVKFWRPQMLLLVANPRSACPLIQFVNDMKKSGLFLVAHVKVGTLDDRPGDPCAGETLLWMKLVDHLKVKAFTELTLAPTIREGMQHLVRISGMGGMKPNTVILGFRDDHSHVDFLRKSYLDTFRANGRALRPRYTSSRELDVLRMSDLQCPPDSAFHPERLRTDAADPDERLGQVSPAEYVQMVRDLIKMDKNVCLCRYFHNFDKKELAKRLKHREVVHIDAWPVNFFDTSSTWTSDDVTSQFLLQVSTVLLMTQAFRGTTMRLRVFLCVSSSVPAASVTRLHDSLLTSMQEMRIRGQIVVRVLDEMREEVTSVAGASDAYVASINQRIRCESAGTAITYLYLPAPAAPSGDAADVGYLRHLTALTDQLPPTVLVHGVSRVTTTAL